MYWLSRQRLPRKAGMAASLGTAVHASIEDLLQINLEKRDDNQARWLPDVAEIYLKKRWEEEKEIFFNTPRRPMWKEKEYDKAKRMQRGAIKMLLEFIDSSQVTPLNVTVGLWKKLQSRVIAVEGELRTSDDKLMGRLDMLFADVDESGNVKSWIVADLKTGRAPEDELKEEVQRQLLLYRDILQSNNPDSPPIITEGWYTENATRYLAEGEPVIGDALKAWELTQVTPTPMEPTPGPKSCGGFAIGKHGALTGGPGD